VSEDVSGVTITSDRASNVHGILLRPDCPIINHGNAIQSHHAITAVLIGGDGVYLGATGKALVTGSITADVHLVNLGVMGILQYQVTGLASGNQYYMDFVCHDLGANVAEFYGEKFNSSQYGMPSGTIFAQLIKASIVALYHYNASGYNVIPPNIVLDPGTIAKKGTLDLDPQGDSDTGGARLVEKVADLVDAATIAVDAALGNKFAVTLTDNRAMGAPSNLRKGQRLTFIITQDGTGGRTLGWNAVYKQAWSDTGNTLGKISTIVFDCYDGTNLIQVGAQSPYV
jgi:hypothetical protein